MIQAPVNYGAYLGGGNNVDALLGGIGGGLNTALQFQKYQQDQQAAAQLQQVALAKAEQDKAKAARLMEIRGLMKAGDYTPDILAEYGELTSPEMMKNVSSALEAQDKATQQGHLSTFSKVWAPLASGNSQLAMDSADEIISAYEGAGDKEAAGLFKTAKAQIEKDPSRAFEWLSATLSAMPGGKDVVKSYLDNRESKRSDTETSIKQSEEGRAVTSAPIEDDLKKAQAENLRSEVKSRDIKEEIDRLARLNPQVELGDAMKNQQGVAARSSLASGLTAQQAGSLAQTIDNLPKKANGLLDTASQAFKTAFGGQDALSVIKANFNKLTMKDVMEGLPPGPATDRDIEIAMKGTIPDTANAETMAAYLRGIQKIAKYKSDLSKAEAEWIANIGSLTNAPKAITIAGVSVPKGKSYVDFVNENVKLGTKTTTSGGGSSGGSGGGGSGGVASGTIIEGDD